MAQDVSRILIEAFPILDAMELEHVHIIQYDQRETKTADRVWDWLGCARVIYRER